MTPLNSLLLGWKVNYEQWTAKHYKAIERIIILAILVCAAFALMGCGPAANTRMDDLGPEANGARFKVKRVGILDDNVAYKDKRGIYILTDIKTGKEYIGISGIGISEMGSHPAGKTVAPDER
jgi:hypothetical protein